MLDVMLNSDIVYDSQKQRKNLYLQFEILEILIFSFLNIAAAWYTSVGIWIDSYEAKHARYKGTDFQNLYLAEIL